MSDETPRELTEMEMDVLEHQLRTLLIRGTDNAAYWQVIAVFHMARRGAREGALSEWDHHFKSRRRSELTEPELAQLQKAADGATHARLGPDLLSRLLHMARRGARTAMAARLTDDVLAAAADAFEHSWSDRDAQREVLLDALTGVDHG